MKLILYIVLVTVAALVASSLDAAPDPPAVNPHVLDVKIASQRELPNTVDEHNLLLARTCIAPQFPRVSLSEIVAPKRPSDDRAVVKCAADLSPPRGL